MPVIDIIAIILGFVGLIGCVLPVIPGPPLSWIAILLLHLQTGATITTGQTVLWFVIAAVVTILDYIIPAKFTKVAGGTKAAERGAFLGMIIGIFFFPPFGMILGALLGAFFGELMGMDRSAGDSFKSALGSFLGIMIAIVLKIIASGVMMYYIIKDVLA